MKATDGECECEDFLRQSDDALQGGVLMCLIYQLRDFSFLRIYLFLLAACLR